jgi:UDP-N-acetylglucosamine 2-epimerase
MKLKRYIQSLQEIAENNPNLEVVYAADDEGNYFRPVYYDPCYGHFDGKTFANNGKKINAVCVN